MLDVFAKVKHPGLKGLIVWVPMVKGDTALDAAALMSPDKRFALQGWDSKLSVGEALAKTLHLKYKEVKMQLINFSALVMFILS